MKIQKYNHDADSIIDALVIPKEDVISLKNKAVDFMKVMAKNPDEVNVSMSEGLAIKSFAKSEIIEMVVNTFTVEELALILLGNPVTDSINDLIQVMIGIIRGNYLDEYMPDEIQKDIIKYKAKNPDYNNNPFEDLSDRPFF